MVNSENDNIQICKDTFYIHGHCELINPRKNTLCYNTSQQCTSKDGFFYCKKKNNRCQKKESQQICKQNNNCLSEKCILNRCL